MKLEKYGIIDKDLEEWKEVFLSEKKLTITESSVQTYRNRIDRFIEFSYLERVVEEQNLTIKDINRYFILGFINYLKDEIAPKSSTIKAYIDTLKVFFMYITENNEDAFDLTTSFKKLNLKTEHKIKPAFNSVEVQRIETAIKDKLSSNIIFSKYRNYLMLYFLLKTGMRGFEVINLKLDDISIEGNFYRIKIKGKGGKERINYIKYNELSTFFNKYMSKRLIKSDFLFPNKNGNKISRFTLYTFNKRFLEKLYINKSGLHIYRHTFARQMVAKKENLATISQWLGHSDVSITYRYYARAGEEDLKNMIS